MPTYDQITHAYWAPERGPNPSADRAAGNAVVDTMTLAELMAFFAEYDCGPTYCLVKERLIETLNLLPPRLQIRSAKVSAEHALTSLRTSLATLEREVR